MQNISGKMGTTQDIKLSVTCSLLEPRNRKC